MWTRDGSFAAREVDRGARVTKTGQIGRSARIQDTHTFYVRRTVIPEDVQSGGKRLLIWLFGISRGRYPAILNLDGRFQRNRLGALGEEPAFPRIAPLRPLRQQVVSTITHKASVPLAYFGVKISQKI